MAKKSSSLSSSIGMVFLGVLALNFIGLATLVGGQYAMGNVGKSDLMDILFVLKGSKRYALRVDEIQEYKQLKEEEAKRIAEMDVEKGRGPARFKWAKAYESRKKIQEENYAVLQQLLEKEQQRLKELGAENDKLKQDLQKERDSLLALKQENITVMQSGNVAKLKKTLANMDPGDIATYFENLLKQSRTGRYEAARYLRNFVKPDFAAGILSEMNIADRQQILPLLENDFADLAARQIVDRWETEDRVPEEMAEYLRKMPAPQAFSVYFMVEPKLRNQLARILRQETR